MDRQFTHYLITRFNVRIDGKGPEYIRPDARDANWERERLPVFKKYCVPTVAGQTNRNFKWLLYCDTNTPPDIIELILNSVQNISESELVYVEDFDAMMTHLKDTCVQSGTPYVITSRLDNDDGISIDYIQTVQDNFSSSGNMIINQLGGIFYHATRHILTYHRYNPNNPFISLIEKTGDATELCTVMGFRHLTPKNYMVSKNVKSKYSFWMTLHDRNAATRKNTGWPINASAAVKHYNINLNDVPVSYFQTMKYSLQWFPYALKRKVVFLVRNTWQNFNKKFK